VSKKQRAAMLMEAAERVFQGPSWYSCSAISDVSLNSIEADKYAYYVGVERTLPAFSVDDCMEYSADDQQLTRELAILMYREAVLAGEV